MLEILVRSPSIRRERNWFDIMSRSLSWQINFVNHSEFLQRFLVLFQISSICSTFDFQINVSSCLNAFSIIQCVYLSHFTMSTNSSDKCKFNLLSVFQRDTGKFAITISQKLMRFQRKSAEVC